VTFKVVSAIAIFYYYNIWKKQNIDAFIDEQKIIRDLSLEVS